MQWQRKHALGIWHCCLGLIVTVLLLACAWVHWGHQILVLVLGGNLEDIPSSFSPWFIYALGPERVRRLGATAFARGAAGSEVRLTEEHIRAYLAEGYLVLRGLLSRETVEDLRREMLRTYVPHQLLESNMWMDSDILLDFLVFGPLGKIVAQIFRDDAVHLLRTTTHFRMRKLRVPEFHYDWVEASGFVPAHDLQRAKVKAYVALYDGMPGMWFLNQSSVDALVLEASDAETFRKYRESHLPGPFANLVCTDHSLCARPGLSALPLQRVGELALKPTLQMGDVILHSTALLHRSPDAADGVRTGWLAATFALGNSSYHGHVSDIECDSGIKTSFTSAPRIADVPRPECFPLVARPTLDSSNDARPRELRVSSRWAVSGFKQKLDLYWLRRRAVWAFLRPAPELAAPAEEHLPPSNVIRLGGGTGSAARGDGAQRPPGDADL